MRPIALRTKVLRERELYQISDTRCVFNMVPNSFMAFFISKITLEEIEKKIVQRAENQVIAEVRNNERYNLRDEKKRPWATHTRRPFRGIIDNVQPEFTDKLKLAEKVAFTLGMPYEILRKGTKGRPSEYDPRKLGAILLNKGEHSFVKLRTLVKESGYDATLNGSKKIPSKSALHAAYTMISSEWFEKAMVLLDERTSDNYEKFGENLEIFGLDGGAITGITLNQRTRGMVRKLVRDYYPFTTLTRLNTNTVRAVKPHTNRIKPFLSNLHKDALLVADPEFDVEENFRDARSAGINVQIKQKDTKPRKPYRKKARRTFDPKKYRRRKSVEIFFGNITSRGYKLLYKKDRYKGVLLIGCHHNILEFFKSHKWSELFQMSTI